MSAEPSPPLHTRQAKHRRLSLRCSRAILLPMIPFPKPRGFRDYALFALVLTGVVLFLFWMEASDGVGWADAALAFTAAVLCVLAIVLARRGEKAKWLARPTRSAYLAAALGAFGLMFGATYADGYLLHHRGITSGQLRHDIVLALLLSAGMLWSFRRRPPARVNCCNRSCSGRPMRRDQGASPSSFPLPYQ